ncbi:MAG: hypothetical protein GXP62_13155 [Oligoflexia bacterium]|nr:hypothetical protein [Oligoflexia bacterium]
MRHRFLRQLLGPGLLLVVLVLHYQFFAAGLHSGVILGAEQSDVVRGVWGLDHQARGLPLPMWTDRIGFPEGVKIIVLPFVSSLLAAPAVFLLGAAQAYNLWILALLWLAGWASGALARELTGRPLSGWLTGCVVISSPMLWLAITDGTPENVAFWGVPALLMALWRALRDADRRAALAAGILALVVAADSPYHAVFALMLSPLCLAALRRPLADRRGPVAIILATSAIGALILALLYLGLPVGAAPESSTVGNAIQLRAWLQWEQGATQRPWDWTLVPNFIPLLVMAGCTALALLSPLRALPWLLLAAIMLLLGLGPGHENPVLLGKLVGDWAVAPATAWADFLGTHPLPVVRFLRRFLVPVGLCLGVAADLGLGRYRPLQILSPVLGLAAVGVVWAKTSYPDNLPLTRPPRTAACAFVASNKADGAMLILPQVRAARRLHQRDELPVYAHLGASIRSADSLWLQVDCKRPSVNKPTGLITMEDRIGRSDELRTLFRDLDDITKPQTLGDPLPPSVTARPDSTATAVDWLIDQGLRYVLVDEALYGDKGMELLRTFFFVGHLADERHFDDGSGITVLVLEPRP